MELGVLCNMRQEERERLKLLLVNRVVRGSESEVSRVMLVM